MEVLEQVRKKRSWSIADDVGADALNRCDRPFSPLPCVLLRLRGDPVALSQELRLAKGQENLVGFSSCLSSNLVGLTRNSASLDDRKI